MQRISNKTVNICGIQSSLEEAFESCWSSLADEHNTSPKSTRRHAKLGKFIFDYHDYRIYYVNIDLRHQYGISIAESQTFLLAKRPQRRRARRNVCFRRLPKNTNRTRAIQLITSVAETLNAGLPISVLNLAALSMRLPSPSLFLS